MSGVGTPTGGHGRPLGVTILAAVAGIGAAAAVLVAVGLIGGLIDFAAISGRFGFVAGISSTVAGLGLLVYTVAAVAFAYGAWNLKPWGWTFGIVFFAGSALSDVLAGLLGWMSLANSAVQVVISGLVLYYWLRPSVRAAFRPTPVR
jgi:hypothetical protein